MKSSPISLFGREKANQEEKSNLNDKQLDAIVHEVNEGQSRPETAPAKVANKAGK